MAAAHISHRTLWLLALVCFVHSASSAAFGRREGKPQHLRDARAMRRRRRVATLDSSGAPIFKYFLGVGNSLSRYWYFRALARCGDKRFLVEPEKFDRKTKRWWSATFLSKLRLDVLPRGSRSGCAWPALDDARFPHQSPHIAKILAPLASDIVTETVNALRQELEPRGRWPPRVRVKSGDNKDGEGEPDTVLHLRCGDVVGGKIADPRAEYGLAVFHGIARLARTAKARRIAIIGNVLLDRSASRNYQDEKSAAGVNVPQRCSAILAALMKYLRDSLRIPVVFASESSSGPSEDFALAVTARHFIGGPSTFSLFAALANKHQASLPATPLFFGCHQCQHGDPNVAVGQCAGATAARALNLTIAPEPFLRARTITRLALTTPHILAALSGDKIPVRNGKQTIQVQCDLKTGRRVGEQ